LGCADALNGDLAEHGSVLHQDVADGFGAVQREAFIVLRRPVVCGVSGDFCAKVAVLPQEFGEVYKAWVFRGERCGIGLEANLVPGIFCLALRKQPSAQCRQDAQGRQFLHREIHNCDLLK
jgi:hypothetical protein